MSVDRFQRLLAVQDHDTRVDQLRYRLDNLDERAALVACGQARQQVLSRQEEVKVNRLELQRTLKRNEDDLAALEERTKRENDRLYSGEISGTRDLLALQDEVNGLRSRCSDMEEQALMLMEAIEGVSADLGALDAEVEAAEAAEVEARRQLAEAEAVVREEIDREVAARSVEAAGIPETLLAGYESLRARMGGVAVARFRNGTCEGCHLALSAMEQDRIRRAPADEVCYCEECGCILIRA
ncbi:zinc ribbon domain-containing protein [Candidatus Poriferisocius sp.]|uniref:zinc ribbon domain-containing protein n=1 Tax=Candidatus Poriferisocius sp. TaxID=3101276 RepID=UPI003B0296F9